MLYVLRQRFRRLCSKIRQLIWRRPRSKLVIRRLGNLNSKGQIREKSYTKYATRKDIGQVNGTSLQRPIRLATFNAALFSLAPAIPMAEKSVVFFHEEEDYSKFGSTLNSENGRPKSILKHSPLHPTMNGSEGDSKLTKSRPKVSINLPENEISFAQNKVLNVIEDSSTTNFSFNNNSLAPMRSPICFPASMANWINDASLYGSRTIFDVLKEVDADILALQDVKAEEEKDMKPLSDLARALGMNYVFAESWAPEYGNAVLSKWPIKRWKVQKIYDDKDFRNVIKATIDVPWTGELNFYCTQLDHLDENWRMKQVNAIIQSNDHPHILAGGINSLDASDYSSERWTDIVKYYEDLGKPTPKVEVMKFLKEKEYTDAKDFPGECEPVVMIAKGQNVQGTCKYGTRVDYILGSPGLPYTFVPGSYSVISSKGTSDHHIVKVEVIKVVDSTRRIKRRHKKLNQGVEKITYSCSSRGSWRLNS
ncbi:DNAse I-like superfamily protein [Abeliophyllum distichum]|uniref:DNAse I-like superfamily protein n=1 Tax=Abeliophyllum distichum TaxID=126358 RepID=A0ABD1Q1C3_9LAMI